MKNTYITTFLLVILITSTACQVSVTLGNSKNRAPAKDLPTGKSALANLPNLPRVSKVESDAVSVTITAETVNLRFSTGVASGDYLSRGDVVMVEWTGDGYGTIITPSEYAGLKVWRGCTSDTGDLGCEAK